MAYEGFILWEGKNGLICYSLVFEEVNQISEGGGGKALRPF